jgi:hypothetical protein
MVIAEMTKSCPKSWHSVCVVGLAILTGCAVPFWPNGDNHASGQPRHVEASYRPHPPPAKSAGKAVPEAVVGLDEAQLRSRFGPPSSEEDKAPGKVWHYRSGHCRVDLDLYPDVETRVYRALAYEVTSDDGSREKERHCLAELALRGAGR